MSSLANRERRKGRDGEAEVRRLLERYGFEVRGLEGGGDHTASGFGLVIHSETKRCETARPWAWDLQSAGEAPAGTVPAVFFRRSRSPWFAQLRAEMFLNALMLAYTAGVAEGRSARTEVNDD